MSDIDELLAEDRFARLVRETPSPADIPVAELVRRGMDRGATLRRRRRATTLLVVCAATVVVVGTVGAVRPLLAPSPSGTGTGTGTGIEVAAPPAPADAPRTFGVPTDRTAAVLADLLPRTGTTDELSSRGSDGGPVDGPLVLGDGSGSLSPLGTDTATAYRAARLVYDDGAGPGAVTLTVTAPDAAAPEGSGQDLATLCAQAVATCTDVPAGRLVVLADGAEAARGGTEGVVGRSVTLLTPDGFTLEIAAYNAPAEKGAAPTRALPPLSTDDLAAVVTDPRWLT